MPDSQAQVKWAGACASGYARGTCDKKFAREVLDKFKGMKMSDLPKRKRKPSKYRS